MGVKQRCLAVLYNLDVITSYTAILKMQKNVERISRVHTPTPNDLNEASQALQADNVFKVSYI